MTNNNNFKILKEQVDEVVVIMQENVKKVLERDEKLENLENKSENLHDGAKRFSNMAIKLKRKMWWKNIKVIIILVVVVLILALILGIVIWTQSK